MSQERTFATLCTCFALLAVLIACIGLYGTMAYTVARRTSEIGIRVALGAQRRSVVSMVLGEAIAMAAVGLGIGILATLGAARVLETFLFQIKPNDPMALAAAVAILARSRCSQPAMAQLSAHHVWTRGLHFGKSNSRE